VCQREQTRQTKERITGQIPLKRVGHLDDIAAAVLHLASSESAFVDTELVVDGETIQL
jgi:NAD(P)-dependent dehydrogenase (short-subunit alcohol dehydrogenase family)